MNPLYQQAQEIINHCNNKVLNALLQKLKQNPGQKTQLFECGANVEYIMKRLINAAMSKESHIKANSQIALKVIIESGDIVNISNANWEKILNFIISVSQWNSGNCKKHQSQAFALGRISVIKSLATIYKGSIEAINSILQLLKQFNKKQQQIIETIYLLINKKNKQQRIKFKSIKPITQYGKILHKILTKSINQSKQQSIGGQTISKILKQLQKQYPKKNILIENIGKYLTICLNNQSPKQFFNKQVDLYYSDNNQQQVSFKRVYYLLIIYKNYLDGLTITIDNYQSTISIKMMGLWLDQLRVMNKIIKTQAQQIQISFQESGELAQQILNQLHHQQIYLQNISTKHPLLKLYELVDSIKYHKYLIQLSQSQKIQQDFENQQSVKSYTAQLQFFTRIRQQGLTSQQICQTLIILTNKYHQTKQQIHLNLVWSLINHIKGQKKKNISQLNQKWLQILKNIKMIQLTIDEQAKKDIIKGISTLKKIIKSTSQKTQSEQSLIILNQFYNIYMATIFFTIIYPQQIETIQQFPPLYSDLEKFLNSQINGTSRKKLKTQKLQDLKKPIHILVDIFISLLTKAPQFLRNSINCLFTQLIPYLDQNDLKSLIDVISRPDHEYIEEM